MAKVVGDGFQGWSYLIRGLQFLFIGLLLAFLLCNLYLALNGRLFSLLALNRPTYAIAELLCALLTWRL